MATNSNELLKFMNTATSSIQEAMGRSTKCKKVNHRKYLEKRLQRGPRTTKKPKQPPTNSRQPIAGLHTTATHLSVVNAAAATNTAFPQSSQNEYDQLYQLVSQPSVFPTTIDPSYACSRAPSVHEDICDPEIESLLSEFGVDSPSQCSLYEYCSGSGSSSSRGSIVSSMCSSANPLDSNTLVTPNDIYVLSPPSDFSDFDESSYSRNSSPVYYPSNISPSPPDMCYHQDLSASYNRIQTTSTLAVTTVERPNGLSLPFNPSLSELIAEFVSTP